MDQTITHTVGKFRWRILALLFFATTINYMDRSIISVLGPTLRDNVFHWTIEDYANINIAFKIAYAIGMLTMGAIIDKVGTRWGFTMSISIWSLFGMLHSAVSVGMGWIGFALARFGLGFGESGNFPACIKTVAEWFPKRERAYATGIFNAGANVGAILAPAVIPLIVEPDGTNWQYAFFITGIFSATWIILWLRTYRQPENHPKVSKEELAYILSDNDATVPVSDKKIPWSKVLPLRQTWAFAVAKIPDAVWWFYLFWGGMFLNDKYHLDIKKLALPMIIIYVVADLGSIAGGWTSSFFIKRGWSVNKARKVTLLICSLLILPVSTATLFDNQWIAIALISLAAASHQAWSANVFTLVSDVFPKKATASVVGLGGMIGVVAGILADFFLGQVLKGKGTDGYFWAFLIAGFVYLIVLGIVQLLMPTLTPLDDDLKEKKV